MDRRVSGRSDRSREVREVGRDRESIEVSCVTPSVSWVKLVMWEKASLGMLEMGLLNRSRRSRDDEREAVYRSDPCGVQRQIFQVLETREEIAGDAADWGVGQV